METNSKQNDPKKNLAKTTKINLAIHIIWATLGLAYILVVLICGHAPFASYANVEAGYGYGEFVFLGHVIPAMLTALSFAGVIFLINIPFTLGDLENFDTKLYVFLLILSSLLGIGALALSINFMDTLCTLFINSTSLGVALVPSLVAPFFVGFLSLTERFQDCNVKSCYFLIVGLILTVLVGILAFIAASAILSPYILFFIGGLFILAFCVIGCVPSMREGAKDVIIIIFRRK